MKIALLQTAPEHDSAEALKAVAEAAEQAAAAQADLLVTPEMMLGGYNVGAQRIEALAERAPRLRAALSDIASSHHIAIACGLAESAEARPHNSVVVFDAQGEPLAHYAKTHLFGEVDAAQFTAGHCLPPVFSLQGWRIGLAICYDIEFPELARHLAVRGAELIVTPTANMKEYPSVSERLVPARSQENALFIAYANYVGTEAQFTYGGLSCVTGPNGDTLACASKVDQTLLVVELDLGAVSRIRQDQDYLKDRRADLYGTEGQPEA